MIYERVHRSSSKNPQTQEKTSLFARRPMDVPEQPSAQQEIENEALLQQKSESLRPRPLRIGFSAKILNSGANQPIAHPPATIQAKLTIGDPGDKYEQEADRVAAQVVSQINAPAPQQSSPGKTLQRQEMPQEEEVQMQPVAGSIQRLEQPEEEELQPKPMAGAIQRLDQPKEEELQKPILQRLSGGGGMAATPNIEASIQQVRGSGQPLADNIREPMEQAFGADFSGVKVHTDAQSDQLNQSIQAKAFTTGQDIFFRQGTYNPGSRGGQELIAHELT